MEPADPTDSNDPAKTAMYSQTIEVAAGNYDPLADAIVGLALDLVSKLGIESPVDEHGVVAFIE